MSRIIFKDILSEFISLDKIGGVSDNGTLSLKTYKQLRQTVQLGFFIV